MFSLLSKSEFKLTWFSWSGVHLETKFKGLAKDEENDEDQRDEIDTNNRILQLNRKLLDHFRDLAAKNQDTDQVRLSSEL